MDIIYAGFFWIIAFVLLTSALGVIFFKRIVHSAVSLIVTFLSVSGVFFMLNADFAGISQIIIYAVGIAILIIFAIMLTNREVDKKLWIAFAPRTLFSAAISGCFFLLLMFGITNGFKQFGNESGVFKVKPSAEASYVIKTEGTAPIIGRQLLTKYVLPFELVSLLLLAVILGSVVIARKDGDVLANPTTEINENIKGEV